MVCLEDASRVVVNEQGLRDQIMDHRREPLMRILGFTMWLALLSASTSRVTPYLHFVYRESSFTAGPSEGPLAIVTVTPMAAH